jgi:hypothetical protein
MPTVFIGPAIRPCELLIEGEGNLPFFLPVEHQRALKSVSGTVG